MLRAVFVVVIASIFGCGMAGDVIEEKPKQVEMKKKELQWACYDRTEYILNRPVLGLGAPVILKLKQFPDWNGNFSASTRGIVEITGGKKQSALFYFKGINRTWAFGYKNNHQIVLQPDQSAYYYDFTGAKDGERRKAGQSFRCEKL
ncbi:MAG: hypothetical protein OXE44_08565 [Nitrospinae bacterium]|nr:hypothetical protein [Nitrospinota bacterium]